MSYALPLAGLALANLFGIISPGPAFLMVTRAAAAESRASALGLGLGVALVTTSWAAAAAFGIVAVMSRAALLYRAIQLAGGVYLVWLGIAAFRCSLRSRPPAAESFALPRRAARAEGFLRSVPIGAMLSLGNPKIVIFFSSIFVALLPRHAPLWVRLAVVVIVAVQEIGWYSLVAAVFSRPRVQLLYRRASRWIERLTGAILIGFAARILVGLRLS